MSFKLAAIATTLLVLLLLAGGTTAMVQNPTPPVASHTPRIEVLRGNVPAKQDHRLGMATTAGDARSIVETPQTRFLLPSLPGATFKELASADQATVVARPPGPGFAARFVVSSALWPISRFAGIVTAAGARGVTMQTRAGDTVRTLIGERTVMSPKNAILKMGDRVAVTRVGWTREDIGVATMIVVTKSSGASTAASGR